MAEYTFLCSSSHSLEIYYGFTSGTYNRTISIPTGGEDTLVTTNSKIYFDTSQCLIDGVDGDINRISWQRTSPTKGTTYTLNSTNGKSITLSSSDATYTFSVGTQQTAQNSTIISFIDTDGRALYDDIVEYTSSTTQNIQIPSSYSPTKSGYTFSHWTMSGYSTKYTPGGTWSFSASSSGTKYTMTAVWTQNVTKYYAKITFNLNGGSGSFQDLTGETTNSNTYVTLTLPTTKPTKSGYTFKGWTIDDGTTVFSAGTDVSVSGNAGSYKSHTAYAKWEQNTPTYYPFTINTYIGTEYSSANSYSSTTNTSKSIDLTDYVSAFEDYEFNYFVKNSGSAQYAGYTSVSLTAGTTTTINLFFKKPVVYYPYELCVRIDGTRYNTYDESDNFNTDTYISFEDILSSTLYSNYEYAGYRTSSSGTIQSGTGYTLSSTSGTTLYIEFKSPTVYYPFTISTYVGTTYYESYSYSSTKNTSSKINLADYTSAFEDYEFNYFLKGSSTTEQYAYTSVTLTASTETKIMLFMVEPVVYYPYELLVSIDGTRYNTYDESSSTNESTIISFEDILDNKLFSDYEYLGYRTSSTGTIQSGTSYTLSSTVGTTLYVDFKSPTKYYPFTIQTYIGTTYYENYSYSSSTNTESKIDLQDYTTAFEDYEFNYFIKGTGNQQYAGYTSVSLTEGTTTTIKLFFKKPTVYYPYELLVSIDGVRYNTHDESDNYNESQVISFEDILNNSLYSNYEYIGYRTSSSGTIQSGSSYTLSSTVGTKLYIEFETIKYTVTLYPQNGTNNTLEVTVKYGQTLPNLSSSQIPTYSGYTFNGYYTSTSGGTCYYNSDGTSTSETWNTNGNGKLYAHWTANSVYAITVNFNTNGGTPIDSIHETDTVSNSSKFTITLPTPQREGYSLDYWEYNGQQKQPGDTISFTGYQGGKSYTVNAVWKSIGYYVKIIFDANGGMYSISEQTYEGTVDQVLVTLPVEVPTHPNGLTFQGWAYNGFGYIAGETYDSFPWSQNVNDATYTLTAIWTNYMATFTFVNPEEYPNVENMPANYFAEGETNVITTTIPFETPLNPGYTFQYWECMNDGGQYFPGQEAQFTLDASNVEFILTAVYAPNTYIITFDDTGAQMEVLYGSALPSIVPPVMTGSVFGGYYTLIDGAQTLWYDMYGNGLNVWNIASDAILYPLWVGASAEDGGVYINNIYCIPYIYCNGGWQKAQAHVYNYGWTMTIKQIQ